MNFPIKVENPIVELDGDEMMRVVWKQIKEQLILPYLDIDLKYYDLGIMRRDETDDAITVEAANAIVEHRVGVKCATITPNMKRVEEFGLKRSYRSPNGTIRNIVGGAIFRAPIVLKNVPRLVRNWKKPITVSRHAFGDQYKATEMYCDRPGDLTLSFKSDDGEVEDTRKVYHFAAPGVAMAMYNTDASIREWAHICMRFAIDKKIDLFLSHKNTILKIYDNRFIDIFNEVFAEYKDQFEALDIVFQDRLIDDIVAFALKVEGDFLWACKNYDGDVQSDQVAQGFGSLGLMTSVLVNQAGVYEFEAAHGTVTRHYRLYQQGKETSTNPVASIFAWTRALHKRGELDENSDLMKFSETIEKAIKFTIEEKNIMTKDLALVIKGDRMTRSDYVLTGEFMSAVKETLEEMLKE